MSAPWRALRWAALIAIGCAARAGAAETPGLDLPRLTPEAARVAQPPRPAAAKAAPAARDQTKLVPCPEQGPGFVRVPGGGSCLRLSGRVAAGAALRAGRDGVQARPEADGRFAIDTRTDTDLGPVRTYVRVGTGRR